MSGTESSFRETTPGLSPLSSVLRGKPSVNIATFLLDDQTPFVWVDNTIYPKVQCSDIFSKEEGKEFLLSDKNH